MEDTSQLQLGLCIIKVLCLIVIAMSVHKLATPAYSYFDGDLAKASLPHVAERSDFIGDGSYESPKFWNQGSVEETNALLQQASAQKENFAGAAILNVKDYSDFEATAGAGL